MTAPGSPGGTSPLRIAGLGLLGLGAVAGLIGIATVATSGSTEQSAAPPTSAASEPTAGAEPPVGTTPTSAGSVPVPEFTPTPTNAIAAPPATPPPAVPPGAPPPTAGQPAPGPDAAPATTPPPPPPAAAPPAVAAAPDDGKGTARAPLRVYNNSTISGLAARAADDFRNAGWQVTEVSNYPSGIIPTSTVYYRPGTDEQAAAAALGNQFGMRVEPRFSGLNAAAPGVIVIVTNDYQRR